MATALAATWRLVGLQCRWYWRPLVAAGGALAVAQLVLHLALALGLGLDRLALQWLGEHRPVDVLVVVPPRLAVGGLAFADAGGLSGQPLDGRAVDDLRALPGVTAAVPIYDLALPLVARGGSALFGQELRADVLAVGLPPAAVEPAALRAQFAGASEIEATAAADPLPDAVDAPTPGTAGAPLPGTADAPLPLLLHPQLLALYNATLAPGLHLPQLQAEALLGLRFAVDVGASHLPGRSPARRRGSFWATVVGFAAAAEPLALNLPASAAQRLWADYADAGTPPPVARVRLQLAGPEAAAPVTRRIARMGLAVDDDAAAARGSLALAQKLALAVGGLLAALCGGYGLQALAAHVARSAAAQRTLAAMGQKRRALALAAGLQGLAVGLGSGAVAAVAAPWAACTLQQRFAAAAAGLQLPAPALFSSAHWPALLASACCAAAVALGAAVANWRTTAPRVR